MSEADEIIPGINGIMSQFDIIVASQDWHPADHVSFKSKNENGIWPDHCIQGTQGAEFHPNLNTKPIHFIIRKGYRKHIDSYSAFMENDKQTETLLHRLFDQNQHEIYICGLALDYCVKYTALDSIGYGFKTHVIVDLCKSVGEREKVI